MASSSPSSSSSSTTAAAAAAAAAAGTDKRKEISILFVCLGNICRSPMAHAVFSSYIASYASARFVVTQVDSAGTGAYHARAPPDSRTLHVLEKHGIRDFTHSARRVSVPADFDTFDLVVGMDADNVEDLIDMRRRSLSSRRGKKKSSSSSSSSKEQREATSAAVAEEEEEDQQQHGRGRVVLFGAFGGRQPKGGPLEDSDLTIGEEVIDPYYGGQRGFDTAYEQMERFTKGLLKWLENQHAPLPSDSKLS